MTNEEKELLLKDICGRLLYGVFVDENIEKLDKDPVIYMYDYHPYIDRCKPYLRPMSSMTEEEKKEFTKVLVKSQDCSYENNESSTTIVYDWYLSKGFDVRGLIPKGLALEAPKDMYK